jgi:uncharacterized protein YifN (PemK superfamily)
MKRCFFIFALVIIANISFPFGKNKVNYYSYNWKVIETKNFRIYITEHDLPITNEIIGSAEMIYEKHAKAFSYSPKPKIKLVIFPNQIDFQQNNITPEWIGQETGGFTEFLKQRVVLPYSANYASFYHILSHELVHAFQGYTWGKGNFNISTMRDIDIPLWLVEGAAEYQSIGLDYEAEMMVSDGIINGYLPTLKELSDLRTLNPRLYYFIYKQGQLFYHFINEKYGEYIFEDLNHAIAEYKNLNSVLTNLLGKKFSHIDTEFMDYLRKRYQPEVTNLEAVELIAKKVMEEDSFFNMNPVHLDSNRIAFISDRRIYPSVVAYNKKNRRLERLVKGGFNEDYLEFHYGMRNNLSVSKTGELCFMSRAGGDDAIHIYNTKNRRVRSINLPFRMINSPDISEDGSRIVFSALENHQYNIYIYNRDTEKLEKITDDKFFDTQPRWLGDNKIVFVSNRRRGYESGDYDVFVYNLATKKFEIMLDSGKSDTYPSVSPDKRYIAFVRNTKNPALIIYDIKEDVFWEEIVPIGGILAPSFGEENKLVFTLYHKHSYNVYEYTPRFKRKADNAVAEAQFELSEIGVFAPYIDPVMHRYGWEMSLDNLVGAFAINSTLGMALVGAMSMSDILGNHRMQLLMDVVIELRDTFWDYLNIDFSYAYLKQRYNMGVRIFNYSSYFYEFYTFYSFFNIEPQYARTWGVYYFFYYPFTTFDRVQVTLGVRGFQFLENVYQVGTNYIYEFSYQNRPTVELAYVHDATLNDYTGPIDGARYELSYTKSLPIFENSVNFDRVIFDYRRYLMITYGYSFAFRGVTGIVFNEDKDKFPFYLGGFNSVRGYDLWSFKGDTMFLLNAEFRFPLLMNTVIGFPLPFRLPIIWGVIFWDMGSVWNISEAHLLTEYNENGELIFTGLKSGFGIGLRLVLLPGIKLMLDYAAPYDATGFPEAEKWKTYFHIGVDF